MNLGYSSNGASTNIPMFYLNENTSHLYICLSLSLADLNTILIDDLYLYLNWFLFIYTDICVCFFLLWSYSTVQSVRAQSFFLFWCTFGHFIDPTQEPIAEKATAVNEFPFFYYKLLYILHTLTPSINKEAISII